MTPVGPRFAQPATYIPGTGGVTSIPEDEVGIIRPSWFVMNPRFESKGTEIVERPGRGSAL